MGIGDVGRYEGTTVEKNRGLSKGVFFFGIARTESVIRKIVARQVWTVEDFVLIVEGEMFRWSLLGWSLITIEDLEDDARVIKTK